MTTDIAIYEPARYAVMTADLGELTAVLNENLGANQLSVWDLDRVSVPAGGGLTWTIPTIEGDLEAKLIEGVIVYWKDGRSFWQGEFSGGSNPPDCYSLDGWRGIGAPGGDCDSCPYNQFGSALKGAGKGCKESRQVLILTGERLIPLLLVVPPSSLKAIRKFFIGLASARLPYYGVVTRLALAKTKSADGIAYAEIAPTLGQKLTSDQAARMRAYHEQIAPVLDRQALPASDPADGSHHQWLNADEISGPVRA